MAGVDSSTEPRSRGTVTALGRSLPPWSCGAPCHQNGHQAIQQHQRGCSIVGTHVFAPYCRELRQLGGLWLVFCVRVMHVQAIVARRAPLNSCLYGMSSLPLMRHPDGVSWERTVRGYLQCVGARATSNCRRCAPTRGSCLRTFPGTERSPCSVRRTPFDSVRRCQESGVAVVVD